MGTIIEKQFSLGDALFTKTQRQVLGLLLGNPEKSFYLNEIVRHAGVGISSIQREVIKLLGVGILTINKIGNQTHYQANSDSPIFEELHSIVQKTFGIGDLLRDALSEWTDQINVSFIFGSIAKGTDTADSDIDVMIITDELSFPELFKTLAPIETKLGRTVNPTLYTPTEFKAKLTADNSFLTRIVDQPKIFLIGSQDDILKFTKPR